MTNTINGMDGAQQLLMKLVEQNPDDWGTRKKVVQLLFDAGFYKEASKIVWNAPEIPPVGDEVVFAAKVVSKGQPSRAMRLFDTVIEKNSSHPAENLAMAKLLVKARMPHQAIRFYGAATMQDSGLIDEDFELSLVQADAEASNWSEFVASDNFPWDGPVEEKEDDKAGKAVDPYAQLLNGATQPVPLMAPIHETPEGKPEQKEKKISSPPKEMKPDTKEVSPKPSPKPEAKAGDAGGKKPTEKSTDKKTGKMATAPAVQPEAKPEAVAKPAPKPESAAKPEAVEKPAAKPKPVAKPEAAEKPAPKPGPKPMAKLLAGDEKQSAKPAAEAKPGAAAGQKSEPAASSSFFKSYDDTHGRKVAADKPSPQPGAVNSTPAAKPQAVPQPVGKINLPLQEGAGVVTEFPAKVDVPAEDPSEAGTGQAQDDDGGSSNKGKLASFFSSLFGKAGRKRKEERKPVIDVDRLDLSGVTSTEGNPQQATLAPGAEVGNQSSGHPVPAEENAASAPEQLAPFAEPEPSAAKQLASPAARQQQPPVPSAVKPVRPTVVPAEPEAALSQPKELDGRTQLVSLAPEDGTVFFNQLSSRYARAQSAEPPRTAILARDMANVDYIDLVNKACNKDLDAFSKLLGLHRIMHNAGCSEWVDDMNLLRKGFGDAVLATVVSKYSVSECREILNHVYSPTQRQATAV